MNEKIYILMQFVCRSQQIFDLGFDRVFSKRTCAMDGRRWYLTHPLNDIIWHNPIINFLSTN